MERVKREKVRKDTGRCKIDRRRGEERVAVVINRNKQT